MRTKPEGKHVEQETADELDRIEGHGLGARVIGAVFPVKADAAIFRVEDGGWRWRPDGCSERDT